MLNDFENYLKSHFLFSHETIQNFHSYYNLLLKWQPKINLIGGLDEDIWSRHFLDSVQLSQYISSKSKSIFDIGSGAGFPGLPLAIIGYPNVTLVESDKKKVVFLREVARITNTSVTVRDERVESLTPHPFDIITSRACADLNALLEYAHPFVSHGTECIFLKGKKYQDEISDAKENWSFQFKIIPSITNSDGVILKLTNISK